MIPTRVVLYSFATGRGRPAAEFRWSPQNGVTLTVIDPVEGELARHYYDKGIGYNAEQRNVSRSEGATFMRALVQPSISSYTRFYDQSKAEAVVVKADPARAVADRQEARAIAERVLDQVVRTSHGEEIVILDERTVESATTWMFVYNSRRHGDHVPPNTASLFIDKATGDARFGA